MSVATSSVQSADLILTKFTQIMYFKLKYGRENLFGKF